MRPHVVDADLDSGHREMARDEMREREAAEWSEAMLDDVAPGGVPVMNRGEVWRVSFESAHGGEIQKRRPAVRRDNGR